MRPNVFSLLRCIALVLLCSLFATSVGYAADVPLDSATAKQMLQNRGLGKTVKIKEADGTELRGKIVSIGETSVVMQDGSKPTVEVPYSNVTAVKGGGLSKGAKIGIWVAVGVLVALAVLGTRV